MSKMTNKFSPRFAVLRPQQALDLNQLNRIFTLRTSESFVETFGPNLITRVGMDAPRVRLRFAQKPDRDSALLRDGTVDLETGVVERMTGVYFMRCQHFPETSPCLRQSSGSEQST